MFYILNEPWCLRGYEDSLMQLERYGSTDFPFRLTYPLFSLLTRCDGQTPLDGLSGKEREVLDYYIDRNIVRPVESAEQLKPWQKYRHIQNRRIPHAFLGITGRCNLNCRHCFMAQEHSRKPSEFSLQQLVSLLDQLQECGIVNLTVSGGEPLIHPDFEGFVRAMKERDMKMFRLFTNGIRFAGDTVRILRENGMNPEIVVSFDGLGTHDWLRQCIGAEEAAIRAISLAWECGFAVKTAINLNHVTLPRLTETCRYVYSLGARNLFFIRTSESPRWLSGDNHCLSFDEYWEACLNTIAELRDLNRKDLTVTLFNGPTLRPEETAESFRRSSPYQYESKQIHHSAWCHKCLYTPFISSTGRVLPCDAFEGAALQTGFLANGCNVLERPLQEILNDSDYAEVMKLTTDEVLDHNPECRTCEYSALCHGSHCRASGNMFYAAEHGDTFDGVTMNVTRKGLMTCRFYRGGYYSRLLKLLEET